MAVLSLEFINKNQFRRFPFRAGVSLLSNEGVAIPDTLIADISITTRFGQHDVHVSQLWRNATNFSVSVSAGTQCLGRFSGTLGSVPQEIQLERFTKFVDGHVIIADTTDFSNMFASGAYYFSEESTLLEASRVFCYTVPHVLSISDGLGSVQGFTGFGSLTNLFKTIGNIPGTAYDESQTVSFEVDSATGLGSLNDQATFFQNCPTPIITSINNTVPYPEDGSVPENDGNIYLVGVSPISFVGNVSATGGQPPAAGDAGVLSITTVGNADPDNDVTLQSLCTRRNKLIAPESPVYLTEELFQKYWSKSGLDKYGAAQLPSSLIGASGPEFRLWPQFSST